MQFLTLPQERYNAGGVAEKAGGGIVLRISAQSLAGCQRILASSYARGEFRKKTSAASRIDAIFEMPRILEKLLRESTDAKAFWTSGAETGGQSSSLTPSLGWNLQASVGSARSVPAGGGPAARIVADL